MDFFAERSGDPPLLIQVSLDTVEAETWEREVRSLEAAARAYPTAHAHLITFDSSLPAHELPATIEWRPASRWLHETEA